MALKRHPRTAATIAVVLVWAYVLWVWTHPPTMRQVADEIRQETRQEICVACHMEANI